MNIDNKILFTTNIDKPNATFLLGKKLIEIFNLLNIEDKNIVIFCIGTDRATGDCLGPLVGYKLSKLFLTTDINVFGTLNNPVHAKNLDENIEKVRNLIRNPFIIAVDASLGKTENIGNINLIDGPIFPGSGVNKNLQPIGDISLTGIVNTSGFMEFLVLQNTRLNTVMKMAEIISSALYISVRQTIYSNIAFS